MTKVSEFKIGGVIYDVVSDEDIMDRDGALGSCDYKNATISLYPRQAESRMEQVLYHELVHALFFEAGFDEQDEDMVNRLGIVFHQFIEDNYEFCGHPGIREQIAEMVAAQDEHDSAVSRSEMKEPMGFAPEQSGGGDE